MCHETGEVLVPRREYVEHTVGILIDKRVRYKGPSNQKRSVELDLIEEGGRVVSVRMPYGFNPPFDLVAGERYEMKWEDGFLTICSL